VERSLIIVVIDCNCKIIARQRSMQAIGIMPHSTGIVPLQQRSREKKSK